MPNRMSSGAPKSATKPSKPAYAIVGRTSDGVAILKPKLTTPHLRRIEEVVAQARMDTTKEIVVKGARATKSITKVAHKKP